MVRTLLTVLVLTVFSTPVFAEWTEVDENFDGDTFYVDFERIRKHGGYVYWWQLVDLLKPDNDGLLSYTVYFQGDCKSFGYKTLNENHYNRPMGRGFVQTITPKNPKWYYPEDNTILKRICKYAK